MTPAAAASGRRSPPLAMPVVSAASCRLPAGSTASPLPPKGLSDAMRDATPPASHAAVPSRPPNPETFWICIYISQPQTGRCDDHVMPEGGSSDSVVGPWAVPTTGSPAGGSEAPSSRVVKRETPGAWPACSNIGSHNQSIFPIL